MNMIACVDQGLGIGYEGDLLFRIQEDLAAFQQMTMRQTVIYGRKTAKTFPNGMFLPGRRNIVITRRGNLKTDGVHVHVARSIREGLRAVVDAEKIGKVYLIGGASTFRKLYQYCQIAFLTEVQAFAPADAYFPAEVLDWETVYLGEWRESKDGLLWRQRTLKNPEARKARAALIRRAGA